MGIHIMGSATTSNDCYITQDTTPNPNPYHFKILKQTRSRKYILLEVEYKHCTTFKGRKVLVYNIYDFFQLEVAMHKKKHLDPHFAEEGLAPIARFPYNEEGLKIAYDFIKDKE